MLKRMNKTGVEVLGCPQRVKMESEGYGRHRNVCR